MKTVSVIDLRLTNGDLMSIVGDDPALIVQTLAAAINSGTQFVLAFTPNPNIQPGHSIVIPMFIAPHEVTIVSGVVRSVQLNVPEAEPVPQTPVMAWSKESGGWVPYTPTQEGEQK